MTTKKDKNAVSDSPIIHRLLREPLTHFFAIGLLLFAMYGVMNGGRTTDPVEIIVDDARAMALAERFQRTWQRPPAPQEFRDLIDRWVQEEIRYREGLAMRLDLDDPVVRRRVAQKMEFISDGLVSYTVDDAELEAWLDERPDDYRIPSRYSLRQVYFDPFRHGESLAEKLETALEELVNDASLTVGDATLLPARLEDATESAIARTFGAEFAAAVDGVPAGQWVGPITSGYGQHLIFVESRVPGREPSLDEVRNVVERDVLRVRSEEASEAFNQALREKYTVSFTADALAMMPDDGS